MSFHQEAVRGSLRATASHRHEGVPLLLRFSPSFHDKRLCRGAHRRDLFMCVFLLTVHRKPVINPPRLLAVLSLMTHPQGGQTGHCGPSSCPPERKPWPAQVTEGERQRF